MDIYKISGLMFKPPPGSVVPPTTQISSQNSSLFSPVPIYLALTFINLFCSEAGSYWLNGVIPTAFQLSDTRLLADVNNWVKYILANQKSDGWLGPDSSPRVLWGTYPALLGLRVCSFSDSYEEYNNINVAC
jgi:hypothetical protein